MSQKLPVSGFEWISDLSELNEDFIKNYDENCDLGYFLEVDIGYPKKLFDLHKTCHFYQKEEKLKK